MPAIIYSETELKLIQANSAWRHRGHSFFIGGSTSGSGIRGSVSFYEYQTTSTGKNINRKLLLLTF